MSDRLAELNTRLGQLLEQMMKETDPAKYDELGAEIWRVLHERERLAGQPSFPDKTGHDDLVLRILVEEWIFLTTQSWIASRVRRPFAAFLKGGAVAIEWGGKKLDQVTARTLKIPPSEMPPALTPGQRVRAAAK